MLLRIDSFDHYQTAQIAAKWTSGSTGPTIVPDVGQCGSQALRMAGNPGEMHLGLTFGSVTGVLGFACQILSAATLPSTSVGLAAFATATDDHLRMQWDPDGSLAVYREASPPVLLGRTPAGVMTVDTWNYVEWLATIDASAGSVIVRVNNSVQLTLAGIDTVGAPGGTPVTAELRQVIFRCYADSAYLLDDLYVLDSTGPAPANTFLGDVHVEYLRPVAAGTAQEWNQVGPTHWQAVDDAATPDGDVSYVYATVVNAIDTQRYIGTGLPAGTIFGVQANLYARKTDMGPRMIAPVLQRGTTAAGTPQAPLAVSYRYLMEVFELDPSTGLAWTIAGVNETEYGVKLTS